MNKAGGRPAEGSELKEMTTMSKPYQLLVLTSQLPYPPQQGATIRSFNLLRQLAGRAEIDLLSFTSRPDDIETAAPLHTLCQRIEGAPTPGRSLARRALDTLFSPRPDMALRFASPRFAAMLDHYLDAFDYTALLFVGIDMGPYLEQAARWRAWLPAARRRPRLIFDDLNAEYVLQQRAFETDRRNLKQPRRWAGALYSFIQWRKLKRFEAHLCRLADNVVAVSETDRQALERLAPNLDITVVPNGVDLERYRPAAGERPPVVPAPALVFTGKMDFRPNVDAACWFADEVFPQIQAAIPQVTFAIVGRDPHPRVRALAGRRGILVTGQVEDDLPYYQDATVYIAPLRVGGGTRLKVLTALAMEKALVSTSLGCEGLGATHGDELLIADTPDAFAESVIALLRDPLCRQELGRRARSFVEGRYGWPALAPRLEALYAR